MPNGQLAGDRSKHRGPARDEFLVGQLEVAGGRELRQRGGGARAATDRARDRVGGGQAQAGEIGGGGGPRGGGGGGRRRRPVGGGGGRGGTRATPAPRP